MSKQYIDGTDVPLVAYLQCYNMIPNNLKIIEKIIFFNYDVLHGYKINIICMFVDTNNGSV